MSPSTFADRGIDHSHLSAGDQTPYTAESIEQVQKKVGKNKDSS